jgi:hypothetical protein
VWKDGFSIAEAVNIDKERRRIVTFFIH